MAHLYVMNIVPRLKVKVRDNEKHTFMDTKSRGGCGLELCPKPTTHTQWATLLHLTPLLPEINTVLQRHLARCFLALLPSSTDMYHKTAQNETGVRQQFPIQRRTNIITRSTERMKHFALKSASSMCGFSYRVNNWYHTARIQQHTVHDSKTRRKKMAKT